MPAKTAPFGRHAAEKAGAAPAHRGARPVAAQLGQVELLLRAVQHVSAGPQSLTPGDVLTLQRTIGNRAVNRLLEPGAAARAPVIHRAPGPAIVQRRFIDAENAPEAWRMATDFLLSPRSLHRGGSTPPPSPELQQQAAAVRDVLRRFETSNREGDRAGMRAVLDEMRTTLPQDTMLGSWLTARGPRQSLAQTLISEVDKALAKHDEETAEIAALTAKIEQDYGIKLDQDEGIAAIRTGYPDADASLINQLKKRDWSLAELKAVHVALSRYGGLLKGRRDVATQGPQPLKSMSRLQQGILKEEGVHKLGAGVAGLTFSRNHIGMYNPASNVHEFVKDPTHPQADELAKGFRGVVEHELSHALIESLLLPPIPPGTPALAKFTNETKFWNGQGTRSIYWRTAGSDAPHGVGGLAASCDWERTKAAAAAAKAEAPITRYGSTNSQEDLADSMKFYFEAPRKLDQTCPERYKWIKDNIIAHIGPPTPTEWATAKPQGLRPVPGPGWKTAGKGKPVPQPTRGRQGLLGVHPTATTEAAGETTAPVTGTEPATEVAEEPVI